MKTLQIALLLWLCGGATGTAAASIGGNSKQPPIERFTRSMSQLYVALASCSFVSPHGNVAPISRIKAYLSSLYPDGIPYWALPEIRSQIVDVDLCNFVIYDRMITYRQARLDFTKFYNEYSTPPEFVPERPRVYYELSEDSFRFGADGELNLKTKKRSFSTEY